MNHSQILKRAWSILWSYRALWIFGFILALTAPSSNNSSNIRYSFNQSDLSNKNVPAEIQRGLRELNDLIDIRWGPEAVQTVVTVIILVVAFFLMLAVLFAILRFVSKTAIIRMVDNHEASGEKVGWRQGFRMGWSRQAWRVFVVNLVVFLPVFLVLVVLFGCAIAPVLLTRFSNGLATWTGVIATIGLVFLLIFLMLLLVIILSLFMETINRVVVLQDTGVMEGIQLGWQLVRRNIKDVFLMWLILVGIQIGFAIVLIPLVLFLLAVGAVIGGGAGFGMFHLANALWSQGAGWVSAFITGLALFFLVVGIPLLFLGGLKETFLSTVWTLTYRALVQPAMLEIPAERQDSAEVTE